MPAKIPAKRKAAMPVIGDEISPLTGKEIRELLRLKNWSQGELARRVVVESSTVGRWIKGTSTPPVGTSMLVRQWLDQARAEAEAAQPA